MPLEVKGVAEQKEAVETTVSRQSRNPIGSVLYLSHTPGQPSQLVSQ